MPEHAKSETSNSSAQTPVGSPASVDHLFTLIYNDLRALAKRYLAREAHGHTLQPTALVNEAYLKLAGQNRAEWKNRSQFFAVGAIAMRRVLVNHAIAARRQKRGGHAVKLQLDDAFASPNRAEDVLAIDQALAELSKLNERHARIVELRFFAGLTVPEIAEAMDVSVSTVEKDWRFCSAWLRNALRQ